MKGPDLVLTQAQTERLNDDLLAGDMADKEPRRNSKDDLIRKINVLTSENDITLEESNTKLRRMTKAQLQEVLAKYAESAMRAEMARQVGAKAPPGACPNAMDNIIALGALRMVHDLVAGTVEKGANVVLPKYGYELDGFVDSLREPHVREATDQCLKEIAAESDVLGYVQSPYARLGIAWMGALAASVRKAEPNNGPHTINQNAARMGPRKARRENPVQSRASRWAENGQVRSPSGPPVQDVKTV